MKRLLPVLVARSVLRTKRFFLEATAAGAAFGVFLALALPLRGGNDIGGGYLFPALIFGAYGALLAYGMRWQALDLFTPSKSKGSSSEELKWGWHGKAMEAFIEAVEKRGGAQACLSRLSPAQATQLLQDMDRLLYVKDHAMDDEDRAALRRMAESIGASREVTCFLRQEGSGMTAPCNPLDLSSLAKEPAT